MGINKKIIEAEAISPIQNFNTVLYTGNGTPNQFIDVGFTPDLVWIKGRNATDYHNLIDSSRTAGCFLNTNSAFTEDCNAAHARPTTGGFDTKNNPNASGRNYVAWCWRANEGSTSSNTNGSVTSTVQANQNAGFSIVKWTSASSGSTYTVGHGLSAAPEFIIFKYLGITANWGIYAAPITASKLLYLDLNNAAATYNDFPTATPTNTTFEMGSASIGGYDLIAYCFHSVPGYSKIGSYTGNGSSTGPTITLGFQPDWLMIKRTDVADEWYLYDSARSTSNPRTKILLPNADISELDNVAYSVDFLSNGFQLKSATSSATNASGGTYIYMAFKIS